MNVGEKIMNIQTEYNDELEVLEGILGVKLPYPPPLKEPATPSAHDMVRTEEYSGLGGNRERFTKMTMNGSVNLPNGGTFGYHIWRKEDGTEVLFGSVYR